MRRILSEGERVYESATRFPDRDSTPVVLPDVGVPGIHTTADPRLDGDRLQRLGVCRVARIPPLADPFCIGVEGVVGAARKDVLVGDRR